MKKKRTFRNGLYFALGIVWAPIGFGVLVVPIASFVGAAILDFTLFQKLFFIIFGCIMLGASLYLHYAPGSLHARLYSKLTVYHDRIKWSCIGYKSVSMNFSEIDFIGIADADEEDHPPLIIRGDESTYVYFAKAPVDYKYQHKIFRLRNKENFILFKYSDKLYLLLTEYFPENDLRMVQAFYTKMQIADRETKKATEKEKLRKKKAKEKKKRKQ